MDSSTKTLDTIDPQEMADMQQVSSLLSEGSKVTDPELLRRIHERADAVRDEAFQKFVRL